MGAIVQPLLEDKVNQAIDSLVAPGLASLGFSRSPSSVVSARNVVVSGSGIAMSLVLADLFGPAFSPLPAAFAPMVSPAPQANTPQSYPVTVTNSATGTRRAAGERGPPQLHAAGLAQTLAPVQTDAAGNAPFPATLRPKIAVRVDPDHPRARTHLRLADADGVRRRVHTDHAHAVAGHL